MPRKRRHKTVEPDAQSIWANYRHNLKIQSEAHSPTVNQLSRELGRDLVNGNLPDGYLCEWADLFGSSRR